MRTIGLIGIAAALAASYLPTVSASPVAAAAAGGVKPFRPILKDKGRLVVHNEPISLDINEAASDTAQQQQLVGTKIPDEEQSIASAAIKYLSSTHGVAADSIRTTSVYTDTASGITHVYAVQTFNGIDISNAVANVNVSKDGKVISSSESFVGNLTASAAAHPGFTAQSSSLDVAKQALAVLGQHLDIAVEQSISNKITASAVASSTGGQPYILLEKVPEALSISGTATAQMAFTQQADGSVVATWLVNLEQQDHWWNAQVDLAAGKVVSLADWYASSESYYVYPKDVVSPASGKRTLVVDPANSSASPKGWVTEGSTYGNNVWAQNNPLGGNGWKNNHRPDAQDGKFEYDLDLTQQPSSYVDAAITQLFYTNNIMHDLSYIYGFDEAAGNFQDVNYSGKGAGNDAVIANAQDGSGTNNANFATPPDGQRPRMRMYVWTMTNPQRDGDLEQDIVAHEYTHGISNRLTGGPSNADCLNYGESGGMGEGWSDAVANILRLKASDTKDTDLILGDYVYTKNIRNYPYSTSMRTNPSTYKYLDRPDYQEVHAIGEVWAEMLYEVMWALIEKNGFADDIFAHDLSKGNSIMLQILLDGMKLQPCTPTFIDARNAILQAEKNLTGGKNKCVIWSAFAKRGLGVNASGQDGGKHSEDYTVPSDC
ncbi:hypothetical protein IWW36_003671 [Coemansia brasiliensis]|uniref:Extracellular metalloproteinase n=1 Tax=Coemansia brasiliensis TaxID=2650707 RepID=A0A9W8I608_9FUNG|nr:hypothetical protein IWW36_003671 [Coemansia brasiliensis]